MRKLLLLIFLHLAFGANSQVKFDQLNVKDKNLHVVYTGIVNTFKIVLPKEVSVKDIVPSTGNLRMMDDETFVLYVHPEGGEHVEFSYLSVKNGVESRESYPVKFKIKKLPDFFQLRIGEYFESGTVPLARILKNNRIGFNDKDYNGDLKKISISFDCSIISAAGKSGEKIKVQTTNNADVKKFQQNLLTLKKGDQIIFSNVKAEAGDGVTRDMPDLKLQMQ